MARATKRYAIVTGANKGIGLEICRQLACTKEVVVVLTSRDEMKGLEAVETLHKQCALSDHHLLFHQLDVMNPQSITSIADFVRTHFGKLDILVNNAGIGGAIVDAEALRTSQSGQEGGKINWSEIITETYELAEECIQTNYHGARRMVEAFIPLLQLSDSPRIINVSSTMGKLKNVKDEWAKQALSDAENLSEERVDEVVSKFLRDFKEGAAKTGWAANMSAYIVSKAAMNAYTRIVAKKYPSIYVNSVCPGYVKTDLNHNTGFLTVQEGAQSPVRLALLPDGGPSGLFFDKKEESTFD